MRHGGGCLDHLETDRRLPEKQVGRGFKFLPVPFQDFEFYLPATLTSNDYPSLIPQGQEIQTIAVPTILAALIGRRNPTATSGSLD